jgi:DNA polymerase-3 subunit alpha
LEYYASLLPVKSDDKDSVKQYIREARKQGIRIQTPDINLSTDICVMTDDSIILPLTFIFGLADKAHKAILTERANGDFVSYDDFCNRTKVNKNIKESLIKAGAFDSLHSRDELISDSSDLLNMEREVLGFYISGHPLDSFDYSDYTIHIDEIPDLALGSEFKTIGIVDSIKEITDRNGNLMAFITISDRTDSMDIVVFANVYNSDIKENAIIHIQGRLEQHEPLKAMAIDYEILNMQDTKFMEAIELAS